jgi:hypothetical protein
MRGDTDLRNLSVVIGIFFCFLAAGAHAADICPMVTKLLADPPSGFIADRGSPVNEKMWDSLPVLDNAKCRVWASTDKDAHEIRCQVNDGAAADTVAAYYQAAGRQVAACLSARPDAKQWTRGTRKVAVSSMTEDETSWTNRTDVERFRIILTNSRRTNDGSTYNEFDVTFLKY